MRLAKDGRTSERVKDLFNPQSQTRHLAVSLETRGAVICNLLLVRFFAPAILTIVCIFLCGDEDN